MTAMTTAMALGPGCRGSDAAFRHETTEEGPEEAGIIIFPLCNFISHVTFVLMCEITSKIEKKKKE